MKVRKSIAGLHLFDRCTGLNILMDEIKVPKSELAAAPRSVSIALTNACDLKCEFCYAAKFPARLEMQSLMAWIRELDENGCLGVGFGGGEPTLYRGFAELCTRVHDETSLAVTFTTHGHRVSVQLCDQIAGKVEFVRLSMDGVGKTYERIRGKSFDAFLRAVELIKAVCPFGINYVVNKDTIGDLHAAFGLARELGVQELLLLPERPVKNEGGASQEIRQQLRDIVESKPSQVRLAVSQLDAEGLPTCDALAAETGVSAFAHIDATGMLKKSSFDQSGVGIGEVGVMGALVNLRNQVGESL